MSQRDDRDGGLPQEVGWLGDRDEEELFIPNARGMVTVSQPNLRVPPKFIGMEAVRELKRQAIRDWLTAEGAYNQMPNGGSVESESNSPINEVLVDGYVDFEKLLDRLEQIR